MTKYVYSPAEGRMVCKDTGLPMVSGGTPMATPMVYSDIEDYLSPIDGSLVSGRRARRYDLEKNNCVESQEFGERKQRRLRNKRFIEKRGLHNLAAEQVKHERTGDG